MITKAQSHTENGFASQIDRKETRFHRHRVPSPTRITGWMKDHFVRFRIGQPFFWVLILLAFIRLESPRCRIESKASFKSRIL